MKHKFILALFAITVGLVTLNTTSVAAVKCPAGSLRNPTNTEAEIDGITSVAQCNIPANEKDAEGEEKTVMYYVKLIINVVLSIVGLVATVMIIIGGISFITSQGDAAKVTKAKNTVLYGIIGLVIALLAFAIVNFVLSGVFNDSGAPEGN